MLSKEFSSSDLLLIIEASDLMQARLFTNEPSLTTSSEKDFTLLRKQLSEAHCSSESIPFDVRTQEAILEALDWARFHAANALKRKELAKLYARILSEKTA